MTAGSKVMHFEILDRFSWNLRDTFEAGQQSYKVLLLCSLSSVSSWVTDLPKATQLVHVRARTHTLKPWFSNSEKNVNPIS